MAVKGMFRLVSFVLVVLTLFWEGRMCAQELPREVVAQLGVGRIGAVAVALGGRAVFVATSMGVYGFDLPHLTPHRLEYVMWPRGFEEPTSLAISPDGGLIACGTDHGNVLIWRTAKLGWNKWPLEPVAVGNTPIRAVTFSNDGLQLFAATEEQVVAVDLPTGNRRRSPNLGGRVLALIHQPEGRGIWALLERIGLATLEPSGLGQVQLIQIEGALSLALAEDGGVWVGTDTGKVYRVSRDSAELVFTHERPARIEGLAIGDGWLALVTPRLEVRNLFDGSLLFARPELWVWDWPLWLGVADGGKVLLCAPGYHVLESWSTENWKVIAVAAGFSDAIPAVGFLAGGRQVVAPSKEGVVRVWDVSTQQVLRVLPSGGGSVYALAVSADGNWAAWNGDGVVVYHAPSGEERVYSNAWLGMASSVTAVALSSDGSRLAANSWGCMVFLWSLPEGRRLAPPAVWDCHYVAELALSPDGMTLAVGSYNGSILVWDVPGRKKKVVLEGEGRLCKLSFSLDGHYLAAAFANETVIVWDALSYEVVAKLVPGFMVISLRFLPNRNLIAIVGDSVLTLWDTSRWVEVSSVMLPFWSTDVAASPDGKLLATAHDVGVLLLWDVEALLRRR